MGAVARLCALGTAFTFAVACSSTAAPVATIAPAATSAAAKTSDVAAEGFTFKPATLDVAAGTKVTWTNKDAAQHTVTAGKPDAKETALAAVIDPGKTFTFAFDKARTFAFDKARTFAYFCERHPSMVATVTVK